MDFLLIRKNTQNLEKRQKEVALPFSAIVGRCLKRPTRVNFMATTPELDFAI